MKTHTVGIIMNGVTGRMGTNQHLVRSILAIRKQGGVKLGADEMIVPEPILVGRNIDKLRALAEEHGVQHYTTDLDAALADGRYPVYFDATLTEQRVPGVRRAIAAGKHIYAEKPTATNLAEALALYREAQAAGLKNGVVQDKLWLPGLLKLKHLIDRGFFGRILSVRGEFGYWVFDGFRSALPAAELELPQGRRRRDHDRHVLPLAVRDRQPLRRDPSLVALGAIHVGRSASTSKGRPYDCHGRRRRVCHLRAAGRHAAAVQFVVVRAGPARRSVDAARRRHAGQRRGRTPPLPRAAPTAFTPRPVWNPDIEQAIDFYAGWQEVPTNLPYDNAFKVQWELFLAHVVKDAPFRWSLLEGAKGVQLAELGVQSWRERRWVDVPPLG